MKQIVALLLSCIMMLGLCACNNNMTTEPDSAQNEQNMTKIFGLEYVHENENNFHYMRDKTTDILFLVYVDEGGYKYGGAAAITTIPHPQTGKPLTYTQYLELASQEEHASDNIENDGTVVPLS